MFIFILVVEFDVISVIMGRSKTVDSSISNLCWFHYFLVTFHSVCAYVCRSICVEFRYYFVYIMSERFWSYLQSQNQHVIFIRNLNQKFGFFFPIEMFNKYFYFDVKTNEYSTSFGVHSIENTNKNNNTRFFLCPRKQILFVVVVCIVILILTWEF